MDESKSAAASTKSWASVSQERCSPSTFISLHDLQFLVHAF